MFRKSDGARHTAVGVVTDAVDEAAVTARLGELGDDGAAAHRLDLAAVEVMADVRSLSQLSSPLAVDYLERIQRPISTLDLGVGAFITTRGYAAHMVIESDPDAYGAADIPVLGTLPPLRRGRPPSDLLTRVVKATKRGFVGIRAVNDGVWDGFVLATVWRVHDQGAGGAEGDGASGTKEGGAVYLAPAVVDGLVRFGWVLRQVDLHYGVEPERA